MLPRAQVRELDMTVDEALKYIISMGVVAPRPRAHGVRGEATITGGYAAARVALALRNPKLIARGPQPAPAGFARVPLAAGTPMLCRRTI